MHGRLSSLAPWAIGLRCCMMSGCADTAHALNRFVTRPFQKSPEQLYGIKTPKDRVHEFRKLGEEGQIDAVRRAGTSRRRA